MEKKAKKQMDVSVAPERCKACGFCREVCPEKVFAQSIEFNKLGYNFMMAERPENCIGCLRCLMTCPDFAISITEK